jgi:cytochrome d ubiquinol oxidase subunit I
MDAQTFLLDLIRIKFGFMACFHYIFIPLTLGLIASIACMETAFVRTRAKAWELAARFWFRLFVLGWVLGVVTGYPLRAQLMGDWGNYFAYVKPMLDRIVPIETAIGPLMLVGVVIVAAFGSRLSPTVRMSIVWGLVVLMVIQSATILSMNAWMQHPTGPVSGAGFTQAPSLWDLFLNPMAVSKVTHVLSAALVCGSMVICVVSLIYLYRRQHLPVARVSLRTGILLGVSSTVLVMVTGHLSAEQVARYQPMKFAALEGLWQQQQGPAAWVMFAVPEPEIRANHLEVKIPYLMSVLTGHGLSGSPPGVREVLADQEDRIRASLRAAAANSGDLQGYRQLYAQEQAGAHGVVSESELIQRAAVRTIPNVPMLFGGFRVMALIGVVLLLTFTLGLVFRERLQSERHRWLLCLLACLLPLPWLATFAGWIVAEMGRQPWAVYGYLPTFRGAELPTLAQGVFATVVIVSVYVLLGAIFASLAVWLIRLGPAERLPAAIETDLNALTSPT